MSLMRFYDPRRSERMPGLRQGDQVSEVCSMIGEVGRFCKIGAYVQGCQVTLSYYRVCGRVRVRYKRFLFPLLDIAVHGGISWT